MDPLQKKTACEATNYFLHRRVAAFVLPPAENVESVKAFFERVLTAGDTESLEEFAHRDVLIPESVPGIESFKRLLLEMRSTFANPEYKVMDLVSEGEKVVVRFSAKATHSGRYMGLPRQAAS
jgi:predicted ester cyclase